jgi:LacI family transcriptional regulator
VRTLQTRAQELGYRLELYYWSSPGMTIRRIQEIIKARGIRGILLGPLSKTTDPEFPNDIGPVVALSHTIQNPYVHHVVPHQYENMLRHLRALRQLGYRRIGLMIGHNMDERVRGQFRAAYLLDQNDHPKDALKGGVLWEETCPDLAAFRRWVARERVEIFIGADGLWKDYTELGLRCPDEVHFSAQAHGVSFWDERHTYAGFSQDAEHQATASLDHLVSLIDGRLHCQVNKPITLQIPGRFVPGPTAPGIPRPSP